MKDLITKVEELKDKFNSHYALEENAYQRACDDIIELLQNLQQTPCTTLREHIAQKLNYWVEVDLEELTGHQRRQRAITIKLCTEFLKLIDDRTPVA